MTTSIAEKSLNGNSQNTPLLTTRDHAVKMAAFGFPIFPVRPDTKRPLNDKPNFLNGFKSRISYAPEIDRVWSEHTNALIGYLPGDKQMIGIDVDSGGLAMVDAIVELAGVEPVAVVRSRKDDGHHVLFKTRKGEHDGEWHLIDQHGEIHRGHIRYKKGYLACHRPGELLGQLERRYTTAQAVKPDFITRIKLSENAEPTQVTTAPSDGVVIYDPSSPLAQRHLQREAAGYAGDGADYIKEWVDNLPLDEDEANADEPEPLLVTPASEIPAAKYDWLLEGWLLRKSLTLLVGPCKVGKSAIILSVLAHLSSDRPLFGKKANGFRRALFWTAEDDISETIIPRLAAAGANSKLVDILHDPKFAKDPAGSIDRLTWHIQNKGDYDVLVLDPIIRIMGIRNANSATEVRDRLALITDLIDQTGVAVIGLHHAVKGTTLAGNDVPSADMAMGSQAWNAVARMMWMARMDGRTETEDDDAERDYSMMRVAANMASMSEGFKYRLEMTHCNLFDDPHAPPYKIIAVKWGDEFHGDPDTFMTNKAKDTQAKSAAKLIMELANAPENGGEWITTADAQEQLTAEAITKSTFYRVLILLENDGAIQRKRGAFRVA